MESVSRRSRFIPTVVLCVLAIPLIAANDSEPPGGPRGIPEAVAPPFASVSTSKPMVFYGATQALYFELAPSAKLGDVAPMNLFGAFRPGMTVEEARTAFGPPTHLTSETGERKAVYEGAQSRIEVTEKTSGSACFTYTRRTVYAYPKSGDRCLSNVEGAFHAGIASRLPTSGVVEITVAQGERGDRLWALVRQNCVEALNWWSPSAK